MTENSKILFSRTRVEWPFCSSIIWSGPRERPGHDMELQFVTLALSGKMRDNELLKIRSLSAPLEKNVESCQKTKRAPF